MNEISFFVLVSSESQFWRKFKITNILVPNSSGMWGGILYHNGNQTQWPPIVQPSLSETTPELSVIWTGKLFSLDTVRNYARTFSHMDRKSVQPSLSETTPELSVKWTGKLFSLDTVRNYAKTFRYMDLKTVQHPLSETTPKLSVIWTGKLLSLHFQKLRQNFQSYGPENCSASTVRNYARTFCHMDLKTVQHLL